MKIYTEYKEQTNKVLDYLKTKNLTVLALGLRGSRHLNLHLDNSDYDFTAIVLPKLDDLFFKESVKQNESLEVNESISVQTITLQSLPKNLFKSSFNLVECLTKLTYVKSDFKETLENLLNLFEVYGTDTFSSNMYFTGKQFLKRSQKIDAFPESEINKAKAKMFLFKEILELNPYEVFKSDQLNSEIVKSFKDYKSGTKKMCSETYNELINFFEDEELFNKYISYTKTTDKIYYVESKNFIKNYLIRSIQLNQMK